MKIFKKIMQVCLRKIIKLFDYFSPRKYMKLYNWYLNHIGIDITGIPRYIHPSVAFDGKGYNKTHLGNNVVISRNVLLLVHDYSVTCGLRAIDEKIRYESFWLKDITIKDNVFIGANSTILPGTIIEENNSLLIACADGALNITQIQRQGKKLMSIGELLRGFHFAENSKAE